MLLKLKGLKKSYRTGDVVTPVLHGISIQIERGEYVAIMGQSGSGKSTLMNLLGLLDRADEGQYILNDVDVTTLSPAQHAQIRNQTIGFVFQSFNLLKRMNVLENVALPLIYSGLGRGQARAKAKELLEKVGLGELGHRMPNQLSGGQQQRVAIARALVNNCPLLLADEPTGNLDTRTTEEVLAVLKNLNDEKGLTIIIVTHEPDVAQHAKRLLRLKDGVVVFDGAPSEGARL
jgi:putative ABC transport system ATP-binding protein